MAIYTHYDNMDFLAVIFYGLDFCLNQAQHAVYLQKVEDHQQGDFRRTSSVRLPSTSTEPQRPHVMVQRSLSDRGKA